MKNRWLLVTCALAALPVACNNPSSGGTLDTPATSAPTTSSAAAAKPGASIDVKEAASAEALKPPMPMGARGRHFGPVGMLLGPAQELTTLKDDQKAALAKIEESLKPDAGGPPKEGKDLHEAILAGIRAGKIDQAKLDPLYTAMEKSAQARQDKENDALSMLYKTLDATQRKAVGAAARAKQTEREAKMAEHKADPAKDAERQKRHLDLDAAQQKSVEALLAKNEKATPATGDAMKAEWKKKNEALLTAFEGDGFDPKKLDTGMGKKPREMMTQHTQFLTSLLGILKPEQREKLAASMEKGPGGRPGMGGHGGPGMGAGMGAPGGMRYPYEDPGAPSDMGLE